MRLFKPNVQKMLGKKDVSGLIEALTDKDSTVCERAAEALGEIGAPAVKPLIKALSDERWWVRSAAAKALGQIGDALATESLIATLNEQELPPVRWQVVKSLGRIKDPRAIKPLLSEFMGKNQRVREEAVEALMQIGLWQIEDAETRNLVEEAKAEYLAVRQQASTRPQMRAAASQVGAARTRGTVFLCKKCGQKYELGKDAVVSTFFMVMDDHMAVIDRSSDVYDTTPSSPDIIASLEHDWSSLDPSHARQQVSAIEMLSSLLTTGKPRWWMCDKCKEVQTYHLE